MNSKKIYATIPLVFFIGGCTSKSNLRYLPEGKTYGEIVISKPRISTRERLINDRLDQESWLQKQLNEADSKEFGSQGISDVRSTRGLSLKSGINANAGAVALAKEANDQALEDARRQSDLKSLDYQIAVLKKQKQLRDAAQDPDAASSTYYPGTPVKPEVTGSTPPNVTNELANALELQAKALNNLNNQLNLSGRATAGSSVPEQTDAKASPIDEFRDRLAYRDEIRGELLQNSLDDSHDLAQKTIYRLSFDTTILPGFDTSAWAVVGISISADHTGLPSPELFASYAEEKIEKEANEYKTVIHSSCPDSKVLSDKSFLESCLDKLESNTTAQQIMAYVHSAESSQGRELYDEVARAIRLYRESRKPINQRSVEYVAYVEEAEKIIRESTKTIPGNPPLADSIARIINTVETKRIFAPTEFNNTIEEFYQAKNGGCRINDKRNFPGFSVDAGKVIVSNETLAEISIIRNFFRHDDSRLSSSSKDLALKLDKNGKCESPELKEALHSAQRIADRVIFESINSYGATPKETVQRVSEVLARRELNEIAIASKILAGSASVDSLVSYMSANDALFHALRRQPLIVGFSGRLKPSASDIDIATHFGWIIGPKYEIRAEGDNQAAGFRHTPIQNGVAGIISVPSFLRSLKIHTKACWRGASDTWGVDSTGSSNGCDTQPEYTLRLPTDPVRGLSLDSRGKKRGIKVSISNPKVYRASAGNPMNILIRGENLWRNTKVLIDGQEADRVTVLPDMGGILAHFSKIQPSTIRSNNGLSNELPLEIITSEDYQLVGTVSIENSKKSDITKWVLQGPRLAHPDGRISVRADQSFPDGFSDIIIRINNEDRGGSAVVDGDLEMHYPTKTLSRLFPTTKKPPNWKSGDQLEIVIETKRTPTDNDPIKQIIGRAIFYEKSDDSKATLIVAKEKPKGASERQAELRLPIKYLESYPSLARTNDIVFNISSKDKGGTTTNQQIKCSPVVDKDRPVCKSLKISSRDDDTINEVTILSTSLEVPPVVVTIETQ